jgi:hypothetical protein
MAAVALDSIDYAHQLEAAGMPRQQAEVVAKGLTIMLVHNFDTLVTKDYLDTRFSEFEARIDAKMDRRFVGVDQQFASIEKQLVAIDNRFTGIDKQFVAIDNRFTAIDNRFTAIDQRFTEIDKRFAMIDMQFVELRAEMHAELGELRGTLKLHSWMFAVLIAGVFIPLLQKLVT